MLILSRKPGQAITITTPGGETIVVTILESRETVCRVGLEAPAAVKILRAELIGRERGAT